MINAGDSTAVVKEQIEDAVALAGYSAPTSWADATDKINGTADQFERDQIADGMNGGLARDRINALFGGPVWAPEGAQLTIDFAANKAWTRNSAVTDSVDAVDLTRAGSVLMLGPNGYESFASGELARIDGIGAQVAPARVNKCTNYNANSTDLTGVAKTGDSAATLTVVDDAAALIASGLFAEMLTQGKMNGVVYRLDNSLGVADAFANFSGATGNTNLHTISVFVRGTGEARLRYVGAAPFAAKVLTSSYTRFVGSDVPPSTSGASSIIAIPGSVVYFILNQLEEGSYASPPIITTGAAVSRPGDILSASVPEITEGVSGVYQMDWLAIESFSRHLDFSNPSVSNRACIEIGSAGGPRWLGLLDGATQGTGPSTDNAFRKTGLITCAFSIGEGFRSLRVVGDIQRNDHGKPMPPGMNRLGFSCNTTNGANNTYSYPKRLVLFYGPASQAAMDHVYNIAQGWAS